MTYFLGFVCFLLLVLLKRQADEAKTLDKKWRKEQEEHYAARSALSDLEKELDAWKEKCTHLVSAQNSEGNCDETGDHDKGFVFKTAVKPATAETYAIVFDEDMNGQRVLEDLTQRFCKASYVRGGQDAERESCYRAGQNSIPQFIINQINRANNPNYLEESTND